MIPEEYLDHIIESYTLGDFAYEVKQAKHDFFKMTGTAFEDDPFFEERLDLFLEWYLFTRPLKDYDLPPVKQFYKEQEGSLNVEEKEIYVGFTQTLHSIFQLKKIRNDQYFINDLFADKSICAMEPKSFVLSLNDIFEARLIPFKEKYYFGKGFCFHPPQSRPFILQRIKKIKHLDVEFKERLLLEFAQMRLKHDRYPHIDLQHIYSLKAKI